MALINLSNITIAFGGPLILDNVTLDVQKGQRICILGPNGTGKSTLLKIIAGTAYHDGGTIVTEPSLRIAYLQQDVPDNFDDTVEHVIMAGAGKTGEMLARWNRMHEQEYNPEEMHTLHNELDLQNGWEIQTVTNRILSQIQLDGKAQFASLSGGLKRRVMLGRALVVEPDVLLLDEPTNHLDIESIQWLESFILGSKLTILFVTHDRALLKRLATRIIELDRGKLYDWACDYDTFLERKQAVLNAEEKEWDRFDKLLAQEEVWIRKGVKARQCRNEGRVKALLRMRDERRKRRERTGNVTMAISEARRSGDLVIEAENVSFSYNDVPIVDNVSVAVSRNDKIGIIGKNGCGKTTLIKLLLGKLQPSTGTVKFGTNLEVVYFDQLRDILDPEKNIWQNVLPGGGDTVYVNGVPKHIISYLQDFLFTAERAKTPVKNLSGGEKNRLLLARMFTQPSNVLVLDEPTNDLDIETLELLEELLSEYRGTVIVVSHDRVFLNNLVTSTLVFEDNGVVKEYIGGYDDWERQRKPIETLPKKTEQKQTDVKSDSASGKAPAVKKLSYKEKQLLETLPQKIENLEMEQAELNRQLADPQFFQKPGFVAETKERLSQIEHDLETSFTQWQELESRL
ncbi:MAG: ATP-binding cassette domain-containing protein [Fibrobacterota bacterium]